MSYITGNTVPIGGPVNIGSPVANVDAKYGPYNSVAEAFAALGDDGEGVAAVGLTIGIRTSDGIKEYWFKKACDSAADLVPKDEADTSELISRTEADALVSQKVESATAPIKADADEALEAAKAANNTLANVAQNIARNKASITDLDAKLMLYAYGENLVDGTYAEVKRTVYEGECEFPYTLSEAIEPLLGTPMYAQLKLTLAGRSLVQGERYNALFCYKTSAGMYLAFSANVQIPSVAKPRYEFEIRNAIVSSQAISDYDEFGGPLLLTTDTIPDDVTVTVSGLKIEQYKASTRWTPSVNDMVKPVPEENLVDGTYADYESDTDEGYLPYTLGKDTEKMAKPMVASGIITVGGSVLKKMNIFEITGENGMWSAMMNDGRLDEYGRLVDVPIVKYEGYEPVRGERLLINCDPAYQGKKIFIRDFKIEPGVRSTPWAPSNADIIPHHVGENLVSNENTFYGIPSTKLHLFQPDEEGKDAQDTGFIMTKRLGMVTGEGYVSRAHIEMKAIQAIDRSKNIELRLLAKGPTGDAVTLLHVSIDPTRCAGNQYIEDVVDNWCEYERGVYDGPIGDYVVVTIDNISAASLTITDFKVEKGKRSTEYCPSHYDCIMKDVVPKKDYDKKIAALEARIAALEG